ncbi:MAG: ATP-binding protein [Acidobacteriota bacterium]
MFKWYKSLKFKIIFFVTLTLAVLLFLFGINLYFHHRNQLLSGLIESTTQMSKLVQKGLEEAMMVGKLTVVASIVQEIAKEEGVKSVIVLDKKGQIKISSQERMINKVLNEKDETCLLCHKYEPRFRGKTVIFKFSKGEEVLRNVTPIFNSPKCFGCHSKENKINGVLIIDFSTDPIKKQLILSLKRIVLWTFLTTIVIILILYFILSKSILEKLKKMLKSIEKIGKGALDEKVSIYSRDEIGELAEKFNWMTERVRESYKELQKNKEYIENMLNSINEGVVVVDRNFNIVLTNSSFKNLIKKKEKIEGEVCYSSGRRFSYQCKGYNEDCAAEITFRTGKPALVFRTIKDRKGNKHFYEIYSSGLFRKDGEVFQVVEVWRDVTERKKLEMDLNHKERLASLGFLVSGISHEINNPLGSISTCVQGLKRRTVENDALEYLELIENEILKIKNLTERLLHLSKKASFLFQPLDLIRCLENVISLNKFQLERLNISLVKEFGEEKFYIRGDETQIQQVFLNVILNSIDAMHNGGILKISIQKDNSYGRVIIEDTGAGIAKKEIDKIFEPFYSGKSNNKRTGLGLFIAYNIIKNHKGEISVESEVGKGTKVEIKFPLAKELS